MELVGRGLGAHAVLQRAGTEEGEGGAGWFVFVEGIDGFVTDPRELLDPRFDGIEEAIFF